MSIERFVALITPEDISDAMKFTQEKRQIDAGSRIFTLLCCRTETPSDTVWYPKHEDVTRLGLKASFPFRAIQPLMFHPRQLFTVGSLNATLKEINNK